MDSCFADQMLDLLAEARGLVQEFMPVLAGELLGLPALTKIISG
jgi:hypothetical protein